MIRIRRGAAPSVLTDPDGKANKERQRALSHFQDPVKRETSFPFKIYKDQDVKDRLNELFHGKCAYCESSYAETAPVDIEPFRPKGAVLNNQGDLIKPGYYWLASEWDNLLPSCIDCNRGRTHEHADGDPLLSGKANHFPVSADIRTSDRMLPGIEAGEKRLLLHPCRDRPERHLRYREHVLGLEVFPVKKATGPSRKGEESIRIYGLNRQELIQARGALNKRIRLQAKIANETLADLAADPANDSVQQRLADRLRELQDFCDTHCEYAAVARLMVNHIIEHFDENIEDHLGQLLTRQLKSCYITSHNDRWPTHSTIFSTISYRDNASYEKAGILIPAFNVMQCYASAIEDKYHSQARGHR